MIAMRADGHIHEPSPKESARSQKGNALVEFALILPLFLLLFMGMVTFSLALYDKTILTMATREGARAGSISASTIDAEAAAENARSGKLVSFAAIPADIVTATTSGGGGGVGNITVTANFTYQGLDFLGLYTFVFPISAQTTMMLEH